MTRKEALEIIEAIKLQRNQASDEIALQSISIYPKWRSNIAYTENIDRVKEDGKLYRCRQSHTSQDDWKPSLTPALWVVVSLEDGTVDKPISASRGMEYEEGKYYLDTEDNNTYLCTRSEILQYMPHELVGHYFTLV